MAKAHVMWVPVTTTWSVFELGIEETASISGE